VKNALKTKRVRLNHQKKNGEKKITLKHSIPPETYFVLTDQRFKTPEKKMPLHRNPSPNHNIIIIA